MLISEAIVQLQEAQHAAQGRDLKLCIPIHRPGSLGGTPCVQVTRLSAGIDWDHSRLFVGADEPLSVLTADEVADIRRSIAKGQSWHAYQAHKQMASKLDQALARIAELEAELVTLRAGSSA